MRARTAVSAAVGVVLAASTALAGAHGPAAATGDTFQGPPYPDPSNLPDCRAKNPGQDPAPGAMTPQQWTAVAGLPTTVTGTPLPQRIVLGEQGESADLAGVAYLLAVCGFPSVTITQANFPADPTLPAVGGEATLDATVVAPALPPNTELTLAISPKIDGMVATLQASAEACGIDTSGPTLRKRGAGEGIAWPAGGCIISISYGIDENAMYPNPEPETVAAATLLDQLEDLGVIVVSSAGDESSGGCSSDVTADPVTVGLTPRWPSSHPATLAVGGTQWASQVTTMQEDPNPQYVPSATYSQNVWKDAADTTNCANYPTHPLPPPNLATGASAGGGGQSIAYAMPDYQPTAAAQNYPGNTGWRMTPDVSALAGWPNYAVYMNGAWGGNGGTSAAAPSVAVGIANVNATLSALGLPVIDNGGGAMDIHAIVYDPANAAARTDVTQGDNMLFAYPGGGSTIVPGYDPSLPAWQALPGFDMASGMGVLNFSALADLLVARLTPTPPPPDPASNPTPTASTPVPTAVPEPQPTPAATTTPPAVSNPEAFIRRLPGGVSVARGLPAGTSRALPARRAQASLGTAPTVRTPRDTWVVPVVTGRPGPRARVHLRIDGEWVPLPPTRFSPTGRATIGPLRFARPGEVPVRLTSPDGSRTFLILRVR